MDRGKGMFITFEGCEGSGKTTQIRRLAEDLEKIGVPFVCTKEPGGTPLANEIRQVLLKPREDTEEFHPRTELLLYAAARAQHVNGVIRPAIEDGKIVLCDRFADSTLAYQGYGRGLELGMIRELNELATGGLEPDATVLFDLPVEEGLARANRRGGMNRLDREDVEFHRRVREGFYRLMEESSCRYIVINAAMPVEDVQEAVRENLLPLFGKAAASVA